MSKEVLATLGNAGIEPLGSTYGNMNDTELLELEKVVGAKLPRDFRDFLHTYGCSTFPGTASIEANGEQQPLSCFFGSKDSKYPIVSDYHSRGQLWPKALLPFADGPFGDRFAIRLRGKARGEVLFCPIHDLELSPGVFEPAEEINELLNSFCTVASSFAEFINSLRIDPD